MCPYILRILIMHNLFMEVTTKVVKKTDIFLREEQGQGMAEYGLLLALVALAVVASLSFMGNGINNFFTHFTTKLEETVN